MEERNHWQPPAGMIKESRKLCLSDGRRERKKLMDDFSRKFGKAICVVLYSVFAALAVRKKPFPLIALLCSHIAEYFLKARPIAREKGISQASAAANCLAFGFTWWKYL